MPDLNIDTGCLDTAQRNPRAHGNDRPLLKPSTYKHSLAREEENFFCKADPAVPMANGSS